jgi:hypothetical protein
MGSYHPNLMKFDTQTKKNILSSKVTKAEVIDRFQDGRRRHVGNSSRSLVNFTNYGNFQTVLEQSTGS